MLFELAATILVGITAGIITGLIPGLHINLVAVFVASIAPMIDFVPPEYLFLFIVCMGVTHTFLDFIPSTFVGVPSEATALSVLPGHRMVLQGEAQRAIFLSLIGSLCSFVLCVLLLPILLFIFPLLARFLDGKVGISLLFIMLFIFYIESRRTLLVYSLLIFFAAGILGYGVLNSKIAEPLFPMLSGLFGVSIILTSLREKAKLPEQKQLSFLSLLKEKINKTHLLAVFTGSITGFLPGIGSSQAAAIGSALAPLKNNEEFLMMQGGINTVNFFISLLTLFTINKARNGALVAAQKIFKGFDLDFLILVVVSLLIVAVCATMIGIFITRQLTQYLARIDYVLVLKIILLLIVFATVLLSGWLGIIVLILASVIGMLAQKLLVPKHLCMACIIVPVIVWTL